MEIAEKPEKFVSDEPSDVSSSTSSARNNEELKKLARSFTNLSTHTSSSSTLGPISSNVNPFIDEDVDPRLDPYSPKFNGRVWAQHLLRLTEKDPESYPKRSAGVAFKDLGAYGYGTGTDYQKNVLNVVTGIFSEIANIRNKGTKIQILREMNGVVRRGETCVVLGRPGSGCTTFLKSIACDTHGFWIDKCSEINYQGISKEQIKKNFRGDVIYNAETETHFPHLTVGETLKFAALARTPKNRLPGVTREQHAEHLRDVMMASFGLLHTVNTKVGDDYVRGISGGERKRVSIVEVCLSGAPLQCWDNSTRGLDSATALEFIKNLKISAEIGKSSVFVSLYQASQDAYDLFDKVTVLYEGRQIYFGSTKTAKKFFEDMGYQCPERQTTGDFLTSLTSPKERIAKPGFENKVPRTPDEFAAYWQRSPEFQKLQEEIAQFNAEYPLNGPSLQTFQTSLAASKAEHTRLTSPYTISFPMQVRMCMTRGFQRLWGDYSMAFSTVFGNTVVSLIISSIFFNLQSVTSSFVPRGTCLFFAILFNAMSSALEILTLYAQRPIVEKHKRYAFYRPSAEAVSSVVVDMPVKIVTSIAFNLILYFMAHLRREPGPFFIFLLFSFSCTLVMSMLFRTVASVSRTISQALTPASLLILALVTTTGFVIPVVDMHPWFRWINYLNPIAYAFESLMINEFRNRVFECDQLLPSGPGYENVPLSSKICSVVGAVAGQSTVNGNDYLVKSFKYEPSHIWRNLGIIIAFLCFFTVTYMYTAENIQAQQSKGEILIFQKGHKTLKNKFDEESDYVPGAEQDNSDGSKVNLQKQEGIFQWKDVCYDIKIKGEPRRLLDHVDGWVKPGTLTALMGASGAGKTTLLDVLASRVTMGVVTGDMLVNGKQRDNSFQRKTGYVQQQDVHLETSTVREALEFSAVLRQPSHISHEEKLAYVDEVIKILEMESYSDAVVGIPGEGLNVEQRKRLTIGVELAARPELLLFLDEPTSGLDSQTAWSICSLMRKLANNGQAILCTIHQPSAILFQEFDRLLFLQKGGRTAYFGDIGKNSATLIDYFERNGAHACPSDANPAEWMLHVIGAAPGSHTDIDWFETWRNSPECAALHRELDEMAANLRNTATDDTSLKKSFAAPLWKQTLVVTRRVFEQYWRTPSYLWSKFALCTISPLYIGFTFYKSKNDIQGMQNQLYSVFMFLVVFGTLCQQIMPHFVTQRSLYEIRERPSKTYSWVAFMVSNIVVELPWQTLMSAISFFSFYYPTGYYRNASADGVLAERGACFFMIVWAFYIFASTFAHMVIAAIPDADTGGNISNLLFSLCLIFCGVMVTPEAMPGFWIFMYRVSPLTYIVQGLLSTGVEGAKITCSPREILTILSPDGMSCKEFLGPYAEATFGNILTP